MNKRIEPGTEEHYILLRWWLINGTPRTFQKSGQQYLALSNNDEVIFIVEGPAGIDGSTSFDKVH